MATLEPDGWPPLLEVLTLPQLQAPTAMARLASKRLLRMLLTCDQHDA